MKKQIITIIIGALLLTNAVNAMAEKKGESKNAATMTVLTGKVHDKSTGEMLVGVAVKVEGIDKTAYTDFEGNFIITGITPGSYKLTTNYVSYQMTESEVVLTSGEEKEMNLNLTSLSEKK